MTTPKKVTRQRPSASSEIAPPRLQAELEPLATGATAQRRTAAPSQRHDGTTATQEPSRVKFTLLFSESDAAAFDQLVLAMRAATGRRRLDKASIVRALLELAENDEHTRTALVTHLT